MCFKLKSVIFYLIRICNAKSPETASAPGGKDWLKQG